MSILDEQVHSVRIAGIHSHKSGVFPVTGPLLTRKQDCRIAKSSRSWWTEEGWQPLSSHRNHMPVDADCFSTTDVDAPSDMDSGLESSSTCSVWMNEIQHKCKINNVFMVVWHAKTNLYIIEQVIWQAKRPGEIIVNKREKKVCDSGVGLHKWRYQLFLVLI